jgi:hypothetical protein
MMIRVYLQVDDNNNVVGAYNGESLATVDISGPPISHFIAWNNAMIDEDKNEWFFEDKQ